MIHWLSYTHGPRGYEPRQSRGLALDKATESVLVRVPYAPEPSTDQIYFPVKRLVAHRRYWPGDDGQRRVINTHILVMDAKEYRLVADPDALMKLHDEASDEPIAAKDSIGALGDADRHLLKALPPANLRGIIAALWRRGVDGQIVVEAAHPEPLRLISAVLKVLPPFARALGWTTRRDIPYPPHASPALRAYASGALGLTVNASPPPRPSKLIDDLAGLEGLEGLHARLGASYALLEGRLENPAEWVEYEYAAESPEQYRHLVNLYAVLGEWGHVGELAKRAKS